MSPSETIMSGQLRRVSVGCGILMLLLLAGAPLASTSASLFFCLLLLIVGLPHGALDIEQLKSSQKAGWDEVLGLFAVYLALAAGTYAAWLWSPVLGLATFLGCAVVHFGEDWLEMDDPLLALGTAASLLAAPSLLHKTEMGDIFAVVASGPEGAMLAEMMQAAAPVALCLATVGIIGLARAGRVRQAACCGLLLATMILAPPLPAFALFFCLYHSPLHLRQAWTSVVTSRGERLAVVVALTAASAGIAALLTGMGARGSLPDSLLAATFMTFAVLTVPHMLAPVIMKQWQSARVQAR